MRCDVMCVTNITNEPEKSIKQCAILARGNPNVHGLPRIVEKHDAFMKNIPHPKSCCPELVRRPTPPLTLIPLPRVLGEGLPEGDSPSPRLRGRRGRGMRGAKT